MCAYPNITINAQNDVYLTSGMGRLNSPDLSSSSDNSAAAAATTTTTGASNGEKDSVA